MNTHRPYNVHALLSNQRAQGAKAWGKITETIPSYDGKDNELEHTCSTPCTCTCTLWYVHMIYEPTNGHTATTISTHNIM